MKNYIVQNGDTLYGIARQFGVSSDSIKNANGLTSNNLIVGETLIIPNYQSINYIVQKNDNLYEIAKKYNITVEQILNANNLSSNELQVGKTLIIPIKDNINNSQNYITYTVKSKDNLYEIAKKYGTTVDQLKQLNHLKSNDLDIGQVLIIKPNDTIETQKQTYIVKEGDSIYSIANQFNIPINDLIALNSLKSPILTVGQSLNINGKNYNLPTSIKECLGENYTPITYQTYTVKSGDNLYEIAKQYDTTVDNLIELNDLNSINLDIGQVLKIKENN
ncbi:MAG: LysM peptidoglycan-binding domain-containing protein [Bacilli bacterium]|nr:LysM peptidoglycan-binding domain-containing protein [Bacilli bacterium]